MTSVLVVAPLAVVLADDTLRKWFRVKKTREWRAIMILNFAMAVELACPSGKLGSSFHRPHLHGRCGPVEAAGCHRADRYARSWRIPWWPAACYAVASHCVPSTAVLWVAALLLRVEKCAVRRAVDGCGPAEELVTLDFSGCCQRRATTWAFSAVF